MSWWRAGRWSNPPVISPPNAPPRPPPIARHAIAPGAPPRALKRSPPLRRHPPRSPQPARLPHSSSRPLRSARSRRGQSFQALTQPNHTNRPPSPLSGMAGDPEKSLEPWRSASAAPAPAARRCCAARGPSCSPAWSTPCRSNCRVDAVGSAREDEAHRIRSSSPNAAAKMFGPRRRGVGHSPRGGGKAQPTLRR
jgi:hypothetical protein